VAIADELGCSERTVRRLIANLETRLRALLD
jgi:DNA-binding CsgD family transcriptional regulator